MTSNVIRVLNKIKDSLIFQDELYFLGGTALSYISIIEYQKILI